MGTANEAGRRSAACFLVTRYLGRTTRTSCPRSASAMGSAPATSARPPVLAKGTHSEATKRTLRRGIGAVAPYYRRRTPARLIFARAGARRAHDLHDPFDRPRERERRGVGVKAC